MRAKYAGSMFAIRRAERYEGSVDWKVHCVYKGFEIMRAYHKDNGGACALYCFTTEQGITYVSENLSGIKKEATDYRRVWSQ